MKTIVNVHPLIVPGELVIESLHCSSRMDPGSGTVVTSRLPALSSPTRQSEHSNTWIDIDNKLKLRGSKG